LLQSNNAQLHPAIRTDVTIQDLSLECLPHSPDSPDLTPSEFHIFGTLKEAMGSESIRSRWVQQTVKEWLLSQPKGFFSRFIHTLPKHGKIFMELN
jgi:hypothetical protein